VPLEHRQLRIVVSLFAEEVGLEIAYRVTAVKLPVPKLGTANGYDSGEGGEGSEDIHFILYVLVVR
jgi:hypothetical protein